MTKQELLTVLFECYGDDDPERAHGDADEALLGYINDPDIEKAFLKIKRWYS